MADATKMNVVVPEVGRVRRFPPVGNGCGADLDPCQIRSVGWRMRVGEPLESNVLLDNSWCSCTASSNS